MTSGEATVERFPEAWTFLGGRALTARILLEECDPQCDPLGPDNLLIFAPGVLAGTAAPTSGRISLGANNPLTGGIKEANAGGNPGQHHVRTLRRAIPRRDSAWKSTATGSAWSLPTLRLRGASVACTDQDNRYPARHAARSKQAPRSACSWTPAGWSSATPRAQSGCCARRARGRRSAEIGHHRIPTVRGQAIPAWDPRPLKATGVTYASSATGADHTAGLVMNPGLPAKKWAAASQKAQIINAICDASGFCMFIMPTVDDIRRFYSAYFGEEFDPERIADYGWRILEDEWEFNRRAGFEAADDDLPECMKKDAIGPNGDLVFDASPEIIAAVRKRCVSAEELCGGTATG